MDSPATPTDFSPLLSLVPRNESCYTKGRRGEPNGTHPRAKRRPTTAGDEETTAAARVGRWGRATAAGGEGEVAAELLHLLAKPTVATASDGDGGGSVAAQPEFGRRRRRMVSRGDGSTGHGRGRERGKRKEED
uniref:DUF834 domain-containing protein n=1 Tax=Oryza sativa subsp. japonica TaxID=39947 RepID=Q5ZA74_ORYSJ|nr:hypothetical protein [Oryza sativa Japonica Group]